MQRSKLFVVLPRIPWPLEKGDKLRAYYFLEGLSKKHDIFLFALYRKKYDKESQLKIENIVKQHYFFKISIFELLLNAFLALFTKKPFQVAYFSNYFMKRKISKLAKIEKPDAVFCQLVRTAHYVKGLNCKKIIDYQDTLSLGMKRRADLATGLKRKLFQVESSRLLKYEKLIENWFDERIIITEQDLLHLPVNKNEVHIIANGVDTDFYYDSKKENANEILFVGNMSYAPNVNAVEFFCTKIFPEIVKKNPNAVFYIVGANPHWKVKTLASDNVVVTGWVSDSRVYYERCAVFVAPMQIGTGLQNKLLEAMSMTRACVTSSLANNALGAVHEKNILIADSVDEWVEKVLYLLENSSERKQIASNARSFVLENYSWDAQIEKLNKII